MNEAIPCPSGLIHIEWIWRPWGCLRRWVPSQAFVRTFIPGEKGMAPLDPDTGQPGQPWNWFCSAVVRGRVMTIHGVRELCRYPTSSELMRAAAAIGIRELRWEHWQGLRKRPMRITFPPSDWKVLHFP